jgi:ATP/maltotriose-dependent transcriptional regulator MalT/DNA-binding SARP family transcriptional activator
MRDLSLEPAPVATTEMPVGATLSNLARPRLQRRLDECLSRRLCAVVAGPGFGKSTLLRGWSAPHRVAWCELTPDEAHLHSLVKRIVDALPGGASQSLTSISDASGPESSDEMARAAAYAALVADVIDEEHIDPLILVLDDVHEIGPEGPPVKFLQELCRLAPEQLHLVLLSRSDVPFAIDRLRGRGEVVEISGRDLAFDVTEIEQVLSVTVGEDAVGLAPQLHAVSAGWPAAIRLSSEALRHVPPGDRESTLASLGRRGSALFAYLAGEVFAHEFPEVREFVRRVAYLERVTPAMCTALGLADADMITDRLRRQGVFLAPSGTHDDWLVVNDLTRAFVQERHPLPWEIATHLRSSAARWFEANGYREDALKLFELAEDYDAIVRMLAKAGSEMLASGQVQTVRRAIDGLPAERRDGAMEVLAGEARQILGDWEGALACFLRAGGEEGDLSPSLAVRMGLIHYFRGDLREAARAYERGVVDGSDLVNEALLLAWRSSICWLTGESERCREYSSAAFRAASEAEDPRALAAAHTSLAMLAALEGDRRANDWHYARAVDAAEEAHDLLQIIRIRTNRSSYYAEQGAYEEALQELAVAIPLAEAAGFAAFHGLGMVNRGWALFQLGRLEEAIADLETAKNIFQAMGSTDAGHALALLGCVHAERDERALARALFEEAIELGRRSDDVQSLLPALVGMARLVLQEEPDQAASFASEASALARGLDRVQTQLVAGWVAISSGRPEDALSAADQAEKEARFRRDRPGIAESLELRAVATGPPDEAIEHLDQAIAIWQRIGNPLGEARSQLRKAALLEGPPARALATAARDRLREMGARRLVALAENLIDAMSASSVPHVVIATLGGFRILRRGDPIGVGEWQSKKARELLKVLVSKRGRPVPRETIMEELWPAEDPSKLGNRLAVALATVRGVLDKDRRFPPDHFVASEDASLFMRLGNVEIDLEVFLSTAAKGFDLLRAGDPDRGLETLAAAENLYRGDFLEGDPYQEWTVAPREEARVTYIAVSHILGANAIEEADTDTAVRLYLRILEKDPYDETAHLGLVGALASLGRYGDARRAHLAYVARMEEIEVEASPFPVIFSAAKPDKGN